ncbi:MAG TPA: hypothetical protein VHT91_21385 [Kofleriaceae bacterium]|jgi:hypothetical protein|nr:hypothetical protein [Kofleriaceae bacterium]
MIDLGVMSERSDGKIDVPDIYRYGFVILRKRFRSPLPGVRPRSASRRLPPRAQRADGSTETSW